MDTVQIFTIVACVAAGISFLSGLYKGYSRGWEAAKNYYGGYWTDDGLGTFWPPCTKCGTKLIVVRPGHAVCPKCENSPYPQDN